MIAWLREVSLHFREAADKHVPYGPTDVQPVDLHIIAIALLWVAKSYERGETKGSADLLLRHLRERP